MQPSFYDVRIKPYVEEVKRLAGLVDSEISRKTLEVGKETLEGVRDLLDIGNALGPIDKSKTAADRFRSREDSNRTPAFDEASRAFSQLGYDVTCCLTATEEQHDHGK